jgi:hypothetical protein
MMTSILSGRCFSASSNEFHAGSISIEDYLRDHTGHLFHGARHEQCRGISSDFVARNSEYNVFQAATMACTLRQGEASDPGI